jgi:hypothetical protein
MSIGGYIELHWDTTLYICVLSLSTRMAILNTVNGEGFLLISYSTKCRCLERGNTRRLAVALGSKLLLAFSLVSQRRHDAQWVHWLAGDLQLAPGPADAVRRHHCGSSVPGRDSPWICIISLTSADDMGGRIPARGSERGCMGSHKR